MGGPVYEDADVVIAAYEEAGSCTGAARLLNARGVPTLRSLGPWYPSSVRVVLLRSGLALPAGSVRGSKPQAPFLFHRLLRCWCGVTMTGMRRKNGYTSYRCTRGRLQPGHGKTHVAENVLMPWMRAEAARLRPPADLVAMGEANDAERTALDERLERIRVAWVNGMYRDETTMLAERNEVMDALTRLDLQGRAVALPPVGWDAEPVEVNLALRALWEYVELGPGLRPVRAEWYLPPEWLAPREA